MTNLMKSASSELAALIGGVAAGAFLLPPAKAYPVPKSVPRVIMANYGSKSVSLFSSMDRIASGGAMASVLGGSMETRQGGWDWGATDVVGADLSAENGVHLGHCGGSERLELKSSALGVLSGAIGGSLWFRGRR